MGMQKKELLHSVGVKIDCFCSSLFGIQYVEIISNNMNKIVSLLCVL